MISCQAATNARLRPGVCFDDADDHVVAQLVLRYVDDVRDRLMLECVSRAWRQEGSSPASWSPRATLELHPLPLHLREQGLEVTTIPSPVVVSLTDARLLSMLRRAGLDLRCILVNDAGAGFTGSAFVDFVESFVVMDANTEADKRKRSDVFALPAVTSTFPMASAFQQLQTLDLSRCGGVDAAQVITALRAAGFHERPKEQRLDVLYLRGCGNLTRDVLSGVDSLVRHQRDSFCSFESKGVDIFGCVQCIKVVAHGHLLLCAFCRQVSCPEHADDAGIKICDVSFCDAHICLQGDCANFQDAGISLFELIDADGNAICVGCDGCDLTLCGRCADEIYTDIESDSEHAESEDDDSRINQRPSMICCDGNETFPGCYKEMCNIPSWTVNEHDERCAKEDGSDQLFCRTCEGSWCSECAPLFVQCQNTEPEGEYMLGCGRKFCPECAFGGEDPQCVRCTVCRMTLCNGTERYLPCCDLRCSRYTFKEINPSVEAVKTSTLYACAPCMDAFKDNDLSYVDAFLKKCAENPSTHGGCCVSTPRFGFGYNPEVFCSLKGKDSYVYVGPDGFRRSCLGCDGVVPGPAA